MRTPFVGHAEFPELMASHFDASGSPDGWMSRTAFFSVYFCLLFGTAVGFSVLARLIPRLPAKWINLPHRDHWLSPTNRPDTERTLATIPLWCGIATEGLLIVVFGMIWKSQGEERGPGEAPFVIVTCVFVAITLLIVLTGSARFRQPRST